MSIKIKKLNKAFGSKQIFNGFDFEAKSGEITAILGGSGVGKSTLLNCVANLTEYDDGKIELDEQNISYVFHSNALIKGITVYDNLDFVLSNSIRDKNTRKNLIMNALNDVELGDQAKSYPAELSAGMAQRISIARAFLVDAELILMDEPFGGLDVGVKSRLIKNFISVWEKKKQTVLFITHSIDEAVLIADRVVVLSGRPAEVKKEFKIATRQSARDMTTPEISSVYSACYDLLTK